MSSYEDISNALSTALYSLGYGNSNTARKPVVIEDGGCSLKCYLVGSSAEGVADWDSDLDLLFVLDGMYCSDHPKTTGVFFGRKIEMGFGFETVSENTAPGYTMLRIHNTGDMKEHEPVLRECFYFKEMNGKTFFAHYLQDFVEYANPGLKEPKPSLHGPAFTDNLDLDQVFGQVGSKDTDFVFAIPFFSRILQRWTEHRFPCGWPSQELLHEIREMHGHVAAVGNKYSKYCDMEWRICFTEVEIKLVHSLNNTQLYVYILLKIIAKHILKPVCRESCISSYMIKNLIFWMAALLPTRHFQKRNLILMLNVSLKILYNHVKKNYLPNFLINDRNLISERLTEEDRENVIKVLEEVLHNGPCSIFQHSCFRDLNSLMEKATVSPKYFEHEGESIAYMQQMISKAFNKDIYDIDPMKFIKHYLHICCKISIDELNKMSDKEIEDLMEGVDLKAAMPLIYDIDPMKFIKHYLHICCKISIDELNKMSDKEIEDRMEGVDLEAAMPLMLKKSNMCHIM